MLCFLMLVSYFQETLLVYKDLVETAPLNELIVELRGEGVILYGGPRISCKLHISEARSFHHGYNSMACKLKLLMMCTPPLNTYIVMEVHILIV